MKLFDAHCDTASELLNTKQKLLKNNLHVDIQKLRIYDDFTQAFSAFIAPEYYENPMARVVTIIENFLKEADENNITVCKSRRDFDAPGIKAVLTLEGGEPISSISDLHRLYRMGIRMIAPTWNFSNQLASGINEENDTGLTELGKDVIREMDKLGIILDVSHLSEKSFYDAAKITTRPICASHSNLKSVINHKRNLTDEQFLMIKESGGVCGINLYPPFFGENISMIKEHIDRFLYLGGEDNIGLGCDFDGVDFLPSGVSNVSDMERILKELPYTYKICEKLTYKNFLRVFKAHNC